MYRRLQMANNYVRPSSFRYNPDKYNEHKFLGLLVETDKAYLFATSDKRGMWVPKVMCRALEYREDKEYQIRVRIARVTNLVEIDLGPEDCSR